MSLLVKSTYFIKMKRLCLLTTNIAAKQWRHITYAAFSLYYWDSIFNQITASICPFNHAPLIILLSLERITFPPLSTCRWKSSMIGRSRWLRACRPIGMVSIKAISRRSLQLGFWVCVVIPCIRTLWSEVAVLIWIIIATHWSLPSFPSKVVILLVIVVVVVVVVARVDPRMSSS